MTQQYLAGEFSLLLAQLQAGPIDPSFASSLARLRRDVETSPPRALSAALTSTLELTDCLCLDSLARGDATAFECQAATGAQLREFGICAGMLDES
jgi:hypothetical protein